MLQSPSFGEGNSGQHPVDLSEVPTDLNFLCLQLQQQLCIVNWLFLLPCFSLFAPSLPASWHHLSNNLPELRSLFQAVFLKEPKLKTYINRFKKKKKL